MVKFKNLLSLDSEQVYVLPVTIAQAGIDVLQSARTMYYVLKGAALINVVGNITKNSIHVDWKRPEVANNLRQMTAEALIRVSKFEPDPHQVLLLQSLFYQCGNLELR